MSIKQQVRSWAEQDDNRAGMWLTEPRVTFAYKVSDIGAAIMRLAGKISDEPISDLGRFADDWQADGIRVGQQQALTLVGALLAASEVAA